VSVTPDEVPDPAVARLRAEREELLALLAGLAAEVQGIVAASQDANLDDEHDPEGATVAFERQRTAALLADSRARLAEIGEAEARLALGAYGTCQGCGQPIGAERLVALPATPWCVNCSAQRPRS
jgi:RNA polymerase-binding transcription factor DksA